MLIRRTLVRAIGLAAGLVLIGGVASAAIPAADGTIAGCYTTFGGLLAPPKGSLRVVDEGERCRSNERALPWSQTGPQGAKGDQGDAGPSGERGPQGVPGQPGQAGPAGPSQAFAATGRLNDVGHTGGGVVVSRSVPAGTYVFVASVSAVSSGTDAMDDVSVTCQLKANGATVDSAAESPGGNLSTAYVAGSSLALSGTARSDAGLTAVIECQQFGLGRVGFSAKLTLIKVGDLA